MKKNYSLKLEKVEAGKYQLIERWTDDVYGELENPLSIIYHAGSHKWTYLFYGYVEKAKTLKEVINILRQTYDF